MLKEILKVGVFTHSPTVHGCRHEFKRRGGFILRVWQNLVIIIFIAQRDFSMSLLSCWLQTNPWVVESALSNVCINEVHQYIWFCVNKYTHNSINHKSHKFQIWNLGGSNLQSPLPPCLAVVCKYVAVSIALSCILEENFSKSSCNHGNYHLVIMHRLHNHVCFVTSCLLWSCWSRCTLLSKYKVVNLHISPTITFHQVSPNPMRSQNQFYGT